MDVALSPIFCPKHSDAVNPGVMVIGSGFTTVRVMGVATL